MSSHDDQLSKARQFSAKVPKDSVPTLDVSRPASAKIINVHESKHSSWPIDNANAANDPEAAPANTQSDAQKISVPENPWPVVPPAQPAAETSGQLWHEFAFSNTRPFLVGGLSGAVMAVATVFLINELRPPMDPRVQPISRQLGMFAQRMETHEAGLQAVQVDLVGLMEDDTAATTLGSIRDTQIAKLFTEIDQVRQRLRTENRPGSPIFNVAVSQLGTAVTEGDPFEAEWVTLHSLTASDPEMRDQLQRLLPMAMDGVDTIEELRLELQGISHQNGIPNNSTNKGLVHMGSMYLQEKLGIPIGNTPIQQVMGELMAEADMHLRAGDLDGAIARLVEMGEQYAAILNPWLERANRRLIAGEVTAGIRKSAEIRLRRRITAKPASSD